MEAEDLRFHDAQVNAKYFLVTRHTSHVTRHSSHRTLQENFITASAAFAVALGKSSKEYSTPQNIKDVFVSFNLFLQLLTVSGQFAGPAAQ